VFAFEDDKELKQWEDAIEKAKDRNKQGTLKKMKKKESQTKLEDLFTPPTSGKDSPQIPPKETTPPSPPAGKDSPQSPSTREEKRAALKEKRRQDRQKEKEKAKEKEREKEREKEKEKENKKKGSKRGSKRTPQDSPKAPPIKPKQKPSKGKKESTGAAEGESDFRTMIVNPGRENAGEFKEYLPPPEPRGSFPTKEELSQLSRSKLKEADKGIDEEKDAQVRALTIKYAGERVMLIDTLIEREITAIADKYAAERRSLLDELVTRGALD